MALIRQRGFALDLALAAVIGAAAFTIGGLYRDAHTALRLYDDFPQQELGAAVAWTCGFGYRDPGLTTPPVAAFLSRQSEGVVCSDLPRDMPVAQPTFTQRLYRYLMMAIALTWKLTGEISWSSLTPLFATAFAITAIATYALFRIWLAPIVAAVAIVPLLISPAQLDQLPNFRDYAKAPFMLTLLALVAWAPRAASSWRGVVAVSIAFGVVLGVGFGFRNDLLIVLPIWILVVVCAFPGRFWASLKLRAVAIALSVLTFVATAAPILDAYSQGSNSGHVALLGLMTEPFDRDLGVSRSAYDWGNLYTDGLASRLITSYAKRAHGVDVEFLSKAYDRAAIEYLGYIAKEFPADLVVRVYGSVLQIVDELPFEAGTYAMAVPLAVRSPRLQSLYAWRQRTLTFLGGAGLAITGTALLIISARGVWHGLLVFVCLLYLSGYPAIQFQARHFFHLEFVGWAAVAIVTQAVLTVVWRRARRQAPVEPATKIVARVAAFACLALAAVSVPLYASRALQSRSIPPLVQERYLGAPLITLATEVQPIESDQILVTMPALWEPKDTTGWLSYEYLLVELSARRCDAASVPLTFRYQSDFAHGDLSRLYRVQLDERGTPSFVLFPVFQDVEYTRFKGLAIAAADGACLDRVAKFRKDQIPPVLLMAALAPGWTSARLYTTLDEFERPERIAWPEGHIAYATMPARLVLPRGIDAAAFAPFDGGTYAPVVSRMANGSFAVRGRTLQPAITMPQQRLDSGSVALLQGTLRQGGVSLRLISSAGRMMAAAIRTPGPFLLAVAAPDTNVYDVVVDTEVIGGPVWQHLPLRLTEWLARFPQIPVNVRSERRRVRKEGRNHRRSWWTA
jgi:hypothetical protein